MSGAVATGCSIIVKAPEETPASPAELLRCFVDAGVPHGVVNLVYGIPAEISEYLIPHPVIRKISFTGSTAIGKQLSALAGLHMKRATMELGGHAPAIVFDDADVDIASKLLAGAKFRNAGQVCVSPTRFLVQEGLYKKFVENFVAHSKALKVGEGLDASTQMGPLANPRRVAAMEGLIADAVQHGGKVQTGGKRIGNKGNFFEPTVLTDVPREARLFAEEIFGPVAPLFRFKTEAEAIALANDTPFGLASYFYARDIGRIFRVAEALETGMVGVNEGIISSEAVPFGGVKFSGVGREGGRYGIEEYLEAKAITLGGIDS